MSPPPHDDHAPDANDKPETAPTRKPWSAPKVKVMEMIFSTGDGMSDNPQNVEGGPPGSGVFGPTYRTS